MTTTCDVDISKRITPTRMGVPGLWKVYLALSASEACTYNICLPTDALSSLINPVPNTSHSRWGLRQYPGRVSSCVPWCRHHHPNRTVEHHLRQAGALQKRQERYAIATKHWPGQSQQHVAKHTRAWPFQLTTKQRLSQSFYYRNPFLMSLVSRFCGNHLSVLFSSLIQVMFSLVHSK